ncbi:MULTISPECIES: rhodanese-like domain-containing protein [Pandoraea]|uniref:Sulfurtransferase n=1 Tax=Pandoraea thiooxydans TaxID=445709 RepID=A0A0G3ESL0_9BURK|nr:MULTISPECIES: rhodanese-like domain-containing protein [Pandoraea]MBU6494471.1 sulfurtransferase [Burkholderiales bacterium]AKJ69004.1 sulfurtransferase [Pandoraea thiooxydans]APR96542.1 sulfurtransferase [Pandoraea thiooxydans]MDE2290249.1 sulfurtransferase [Burkholderiales bacterium]TAL55387.1 MAG: sulfurtransferase [Pandoraea sp.]
MQQIQPNELAAWLGDAGRRPPVLLDVREPWEVQTCHLPGIVHIPMGQIPQRFNELDPDAEIVCICHHGARSLQVAMFLARQGFSELFNLSGGVDAWARQVDPTMAVY